MRNLENNWIILDALGNIFEIYAILTVMTLLKLSHIWITHAELCLIVFLCIFYYCVQFFNFGYLISFALHTLLAPIPYVYEITPSGVSILSSFALSAILLTFLMNTLCVSILSLC